MKYSSLLNANVIKLILYLLYMYLGIFGYVLAFVVTLYFNRIIWFTAKGASFDNIEGFGSSVQNDDFGSVVCEGWPSPTRLSRKNNEISSPNRRNTSILTKKRY